MPSLPGYGWSDRPTEPGWGIERIADAWATLMRRLGYDRYGAQGGDWGAAVTTCLGEQHPADLVGVHLNMVRATPARGQTEFTEAEQATIASGVHYQEWESGYSQQQTTRPQTLGYGLADSAVGQCAWILEKYSAWQASRQHGHWRSRGTAARCRRTASDFSRVGTMVIGGVQVGFAEDRVPTHGFRVGARSERTRPARRRADRSPKRGGHFAAFEQPAIFANEIRNFFRLLR